MMLGQCWCQNYCPAVFIILFLSWEGLNGELLPGFSIQVTKELTVQRGLCVYIPCRFTYETQHGNLVSADSKMIWKINGKVYLSSKPVLLNSLDKKIKQGDCSFKISNVSMENQGNYYFRIEGTDKLQWNYEDIKPYVSVKELTDKPQISSDETLIASKEVTLTCTAPGRCAGTAPIITWEGNLSNRTVAYNMTYTDGNSTYYSNITFTPSYKDNSTSLKCKVTYQSPGFPTTSDKMTLNVEYPPLVNIQIEGKNTSVAVLEGRSVFLQCIVNSNPAGDITWMANSKVLNSTKSGNSLSLLIQNVSSSANPTYTCSSNNTHGNNRADAHITVDYPPRRPAIYDSNDNSLQDNSTQEVVQGSTLSLECRVESSPSASFKWLKPNKTVSEGMKLIVTSLSESDYGLYICNATNKYGNSSISINIIHKNYVPKEGNTASIIGGIFGGVLILLIFILAVLFTIYILKKRRFDKDKIVKSPPVAEVIYNNTQPSEHTPQGNQTTTEESLYVNYGHDVNSGNEVNYVTIDFSKLKPKTLPDEQANGDILYSEIIRHK
ncbi:sialic acid-binding Ig-like lectin 14 [Bombina bombina]|uniref:sialic acid-binding Ig-like lectin 14 n=1 Tax=Bombina bombina TaxID=8345 RepID=UPI00235AC148|nr:sialic acid-binding Ig-like lectin 14 [Bombina bombina]